MSSEGLAALKIDRTRRRSAGLPWKWIIVVLLIVGGVFAFPQVSKFLEVEVGTAPVVKMRGGSFTPSSSTGKAESAELTAAGYIVADRQSVLAFKGTGRLAKLNVAESQRVKKGDEIAEIDHHELDAQIRQAEAAQKELHTEVERRRKMVAQSEAETGAAQMTINTLNAEITEIKIRLADANRRLEMSKNVAANQAMAQSAVDDRVTEVRAAEAQIATAELRKLEAQQKIKIAEAQSEVARSNIAVGEASEQSAAATVSVLKAQLEDAFIYSPFDGVVTEKAAEVGEIVAPISIGGSMARGSIATIAEWNSLQAEVDVAETYIHQIKPGQRAAITVDAFADKVFPGKTIRILPRANRSKATVLVRVEFLKRDDGVLPEMGVRVRFLPDDAPEGIESGAVKDTLVIPKLAVLAADNTKFVWVINAENTVRKQVVTVGEAKDDLVEIQTGLNASDTVVTTNAAKLTQDGQKVRVANK